MNRKKPYTAFPHWNSGFRTSRRSRVCTAIYIGPLFESTTHGYDTKDYKQVDRRLGDNADFAAYVKSPRTRHQSRRRRCLQPHRPRIPLPSATFRKKENSPRTADGTKESGSAGNTCYNDGFSYEAWRNCFRTRQPESPETSRSATISLMSSTSGSTNSTSTASVSTAPTA